MKVSILINNYNYARFLDECILSLQNQTYKNIEIILYDDGSTDNSLEVASKYEFVKVVSNRNFGKKPSFNQANAINTAFMHSEGDIVCLLDSDDFFAENKIAAVVECFTKNTDCVLIQHGAYEYLGGKVTCVHDYSSSSLDYKKLYYSKKWTGFFNPTSTLSFTRTYLEKVLPLQQDRYWRVWPDVRLSRLAPFYGKVISLKDCLTYYRKHGSNDSSTMNRKGLATFKNQIAHHLFVNEAISKLGGKKVPFYLSINFLKFLLKAIFPVNKLKHKNA